MAEKCTEPRLMGSKGVGIPTHPGAGSRYITPNQTSVASYEMIAAIGGCNV